MVSPGGIGYDINCGVRLLATELSAAELGAARLGRLVEALHGAVPAGVGSRRSDLALRGKDLDRVLTGILEKGFSLSELIETGEKPELAHRVFSLLMGAEFKRRQAPLGPTVSARPLSEVRVPVTKSKDWWSVAEKALGKNQHKK